MKKYLITIAILSVFFIGCSTANIDYRHGNLSTKTLEERLDLARKEYRIAKEEGRSTEKAETTIGDLVSKLSENEERVSYSDRFGNPKDLDRVSDARKSAKNLDEGNKTCVGIIKNFNTSKMIEFKIKGPEEKTILLGPGEETKEYLKEGVYVLATRHIPSEEILKYKDEFKVESSSEKIFLKKKCFWYVHAE